MDLLENSHQDPGSRLIEIPCSRSAADERFAITQAEVNEVLETVQEDYTTLCRYLVDYGFLGRTRDGSEYWVE